MAVSDLTGHYIADTYQNVVQCDFDLNGSTNNLLYNGKGLPIVIDSDIIKFSLATGGGLQTFGGNFVLRSISGDVYISTNNQIITLGQDSFGNNTTWIYLFSNDLIQLNAGRVKMIGVNNSHTINPQIGRGSDGSGGSVYTTTITDGLLGYSTEILSTHPVNLCANGSYGGPSSPYLLFETGKPGRAFAWGDNNELKIIDAVDYDRVITIVVNLQEVNGYSEHVDTNVYFKLTNGSIILPIPLISKVQESDFRYPGLGISADNSGNNNNTINFQFIMTSGFYLLSYRGRVNSSGGSALDGYGLILRGYEQKLGL